MKNFAGQNLELLGHVDVDSGSVWIGDPCYIIKDEDEPRPKDLGSNWSDLCKKFFERSGYDKQSLEWSAYMNRAEREFFDNLRERGSDFTPQDIKQEYHDHMEKWTKDNPFIPKTIDTQFAVFGHDLGHSGMGIMTNTYYGDGTYPVYAIRSKGGRIKQLVIDFVPGEDDDEDCQS